MPSEGKVTRAYMAVQNLITKYLEQGESPSTDLLMEAFYGSDFNRDSREQRNIVYESVIKGRKIAIDFWNKYAGTPEFYQTVMYIRFYEVDAYENERNTDEYREFFAKLRDGWFGRQTDDIVQNIEDYPAVAILFERKMQEYSRIGHNFVISTGGNRSIWFRPKLWNAYIRDRDELLRTLKRLATQIERGKKMRLLLPSGVSLEKLTGATKVLEATIKNTTSWTCSKCGSMNPTEQTECGICETQREA